MALELTCINSITDVAASEWNEVLEDQNPFIQHAFLLALEHAGITTEETGWQVQHLLVSDAGRLVAVMPLYLKFHSFGEYVFDQAWADAYQRHGLAYYPKLLSAIPYTPVTGSRLAIRPECDKHGVMARVSAFLRHHCTEKGISSCHVLFEQGRLLWHQQASKFIERSSVNFQWFNRGFTSFGHYLEHFNSRKRKTVRKERQQVLHQGIQVEVLEGAQISTEIWQKFYFFYQLTYCKRSGHGGYLNVDFFKQLALNMPESIVMFIGKKAGDIVAAALCFRDDKNLYGRYWGASESLDFLHFELCYYQGIEYCIKHGLQRFDPGVQGVHKVARGFEPVYTYSQHWLAQPAFHQAVEDFVVTESAQLTDFKSEAEQRLPFKQEIS